MSTEDKKRRNKIEAIVVGCFAIGIALSVYTGCPLFYPTATCISVALCNKFVK